MITGAALSGRGFWKQTFNCEW